MLPERLDGVIQLDAAPVHLVSLRGQRVGDVLAGNRAEQFAFLACFARQRQFDRPERRRRLLRLSALGLVPDPPRLRFGGDALLVAFGGLVRESLRQEVIPGVTGLHAHHLPGLAEGPHVLAQDHFHHRWYPLVVGVDSRRRKSSQVSASPSNVSPPRTNGSRNRAMNANTVATGAATPPAWATTTARPRTAYSTPSTSRRLAPASRHGSGTGSTASASATTQPQTSWSLK